MSNINLTLDKIDSNHASVEVDSVLNEEQIDSISIYANTVSSGKIKLTINKKGVDILSIIFDVGQPNANMAIDLTSDVLKGIDLDLVIATDAITGVVEKHVVNQRLNADKLLNLFY